MGKTLYEKVYDAHVVYQAEGELPLLYIDRHIIHEVTSPQAFSGLREAGRKIRRPELMMATMDHDISTQKASIDACSCVARTQVTTLMKNCEDFGVKLFGLGHPNQGIVHIIGPQTGFTLPGTTLVCGDSHTATHGAFGALAFGIGTSEVEHVMATQTLKQAKLKTMRNTLVIFLVSGFWHGANWTFICWGAYHALLFLPLLAFGKNRKHTDVVAQGRLLPSLRELVQMLTTFILAMVGWVIFRAENIGQAWDYIVRMVTQFQFALPAHDKDPLIYIGILVVVEWLMRTKQFGLQFEERGILRHRAVRWALYYVIFITTFLLAGQQAEFIYFQF